MNETGIERFVEVPQGSGLSAEAFEMLPCLAMLVQDGMVIRRNGLARRLTGILGERSEVVPITDVLEDGCAGVDEEPERARVRFDGSLRRRHGRPLKVSCAAQMVEFAGEFCTLLVMMEHTRPVDAAREETFLDDLMEALPRATAITHGGRVLHVNSEFLQMFDYTSAEVLGQELDELILPDGRMHENEVIQLNLDRTGRADMDTERRTRTGQTLHTHVMASRLSLGAGADGMFLTFQDIGREKHEEERLRHHALHDGLTGLANRGLFLNRAELMLSRLRRRPNRGFAIYFIDLDGFKQVNDELGHAAGDVVLMETARRLQDCVRPQDTVARFGGDEFALLVDETGSSEEMVRIAERLHEEIRKPIRWGGEVARVSASIGIALASANYADAAEMLRDADVAMYRAKNAGKDQYSVFGSEELLPYELLR